MSSRCLYIDLGINIIGVNEFYQNYLNTIIDLISEKTFETLKLDLESNKQILIHNLVVILLQL